jgi:2-phosphosulfolactate phosphatase
MRPVFTGPVRPARPPSVAVVVDVMRAFTVAALLLARGAERIVVAGTPEEALELKARHPGWLALKDGPPAPGFDLVNSPGLLAPLDVRGRTVVQKTTAGTVGALAVADADLVLCAGFVVAGATAEVLGGRRPKEVTFVVTGDDGRGEEDRACAEYIAERAVTDSVDPLPFVERARSSAAARQLAEGLRRGYRGVHPDDVRLCLEVDAYPFAVAGTREGGLLVLRPAGP